MAACIGRRGGAWRGDGRFRRTGVAGRHRRMRRSAGSGRMLEGVPALLGYLPGGFPGARVDMSTLSDLIRDAGLAGRGGGGFATASKIELAERNRADLIINACDGEIGAAKDGWVIAHHLLEVLDAARQLTRGRMAAISGAGAGMRDPQDLHLFAEAPGGLLR